MLRRKSRQTAPTESEPGSRALAMVLLHSPSGVDPKALTQAWKGAWPGLAAPHGFVNRVDENGLSAATFDVGAFHGVYALMPVPVPGDELVGPAATTWLWPNASDEIDNVTAHIVVSVSGSRTLDVHRALTRLVVAVLRVVGDDALGVYWGSAGLIVKADAFINLAAEKTPVMLWVDFRAMANKKKSETSLITFGMAELGVPELEIPVSTKPVGELRLFAMNLAAYVIERGPVIADGHTVGGTTDEKILVRHAPSMIERPGPVYRLEGL